ncbi:MAG: MFS transporter [Sphingomonas oligoaromativorans]|jgi:FHS family L-fucose permease-like MFS transporter|uniref:MFS transporter n=1 Tax=Sphingomonas oligoaromativorans TaxID=575322 RepID=UPI001FB973D7|nr:MFS transporter [Sphingomonas oligoaromativorans]NIJ31877.1 FHS family L-fucose permease-like MFS transporter [Sphingomonas oligoaromativorans]
MQSRSAAGALPAFITVTCLFFAWGFITSNNDPLIAALRGIYSLSRAEAMLTQFAFFLAYGVFSLPAAAVLGRLGPSRTIMAALGVMILGCLIVLAASAARTYALVLVALFTLAAGITALQVAANPLAAALGAPEKSHFRLTLAQAFNSLGVVLGVHLGSSLMLSGDVFKDGGATITDEASRVAGLGAVNHAFLIIAAFLLALGLLIFVMRHRIENAVPHRGGAGATGENASPLAALRSGWALAGALTIFLYVGSEVSIGSIMINFLNQPEVLGVSLLVAGGMLANYYWGGALVGRFIGSGLLAVFPAPILLAVMVAAAGLLSLAAFTLSGPAAAWCALSIGLFNSIMFPTIFTLTLQRSSAPASATSGLLCVAIFGGAVLPIVAGKIADVTGGFGHAFIVPVIGYAGIFIFALAAARVKGAEHATVALPAGH